jgi:hypothetical protein
MGWQKQLIYVSLIVDLDFLLTYLCGTTTNIWLRPVKEDLSMTACLKHSASNLWLLGSGYRSSPHPPISILVFLDFSFHWVWLWIELLVVGLRVFWLCDQHSAICLFSWHLGHSSCLTLYRVRGCTFSCAFSFSIFGPHIVRRSSFWMFMWIFLCFKSFFRIFLAMLIVFWGFLKVLWLSSGI